MLESGMVRSKMWQPFALKHLFVLNRRLMYWLVGYNLMYGIEEGGYIGELFSIWSVDDSAIAGEALISRAARRRSDWYFQMVFCATTASIVLEQSPSA